MVWLVEDAGEILVRMSGALDEHGLAVFPAVPDGQGFVVSWPYDDDPESFVATCAGLDVPVLYMASARASDLAGDEVEVEPGREDEVVLVVAAGVVGGVLHQLQVASRWWDELEQTREFVADLEVRDERARIEQLARQVVDDPVFHDHGSTGRHARQEAVVAARFPELEERTVRRVAGHASRIDATERKAAREAEMAEKAREMMTAGSPRRAAAAKLGISDNVLARILEQNP